MRAIIEIQYVQLLDLDMGSICTLDSKEHKDILYMCGQVLSNNNQRWVTNITTGEVVCLGGYYQVASYYSSRLVLIQHPSGLPKEERTEQEKQ